MPFDLSRLFLSLAMACLCGCAGTTNQSPVRKVACTKDMQHFEARARQLGNETYPKVVELLDDQSPRVPRQFSIVLKPLKSENTAETHVPKGTIFANSKYLSTNSMTYFDNVLVHEMAHLLQRYPTNAPPYWVEGIADYVRYKLGFTNGIEGPLCSASYPHYTAGYQCAGAFLLYIDTTYGLGLVRKLHRDLRDNCYSDAVFPVMTGKTLGQLWADFQQTPAFPAVARRVNEAYAALGCACPVPRHVEAYVFDQLGGRTTRQAGDFLNDLRGKGLLPGVTKDEHGTLTPVIPPGARVSDGSPLSRTFVCMRKEKEEGCRYLLVRESEDAAWRLAAAWRVTSNGRIIEPLTLPQVRANP